MDTKFGKGSFERHKKEAMNIAAPVEVINLPGFAFDVDTEQDLIDFINTSSISDQISFKKLDFKYSSGWILLSNTTEIKFGKNITTARLNSFRQSLNYVYESKSIPSMIDLRYKDGVAFDYGK